MVDETGELLPRKRRWPLMLAAVAGLIALLVAAGFLYDLLWQRKVDALLASYRAKGEPVTWEEVLAARDTLPAEENSALIFQEALAMMPQERDPTADAVMSLLAVDDPGSRPAPRTVELLRSHIKEQAPVLAIIHEGAALSAGVYPVYSIEAASYGPLPYLRLLRHATQLCAREAELRALDGDGAGAVESLVAARRLCASIGEGWLLIEEMVRMACGSITVTAVEKSLALCQFPPEGLDRLRQELAREEAELSLRRGLMGMRAVGYRIFMQVSTGAFVREMQIDSDNLHRLAVLLNTIVPGMRSKDALLYFQTIDRYLAGADMLLRQQVLKNRGLDGEVSAALKGHDVGFIAHYTSGWILPGLAGTDTRAVWARVGLRVADTALAVEEWRLKHGRWPDALDALVPEVLKAVPEDPYTGGDMLYMRTESGVAVYSVGPDGVDDGGLTESDARTQNRPGGQCDLPFRLLNPELRGVAQMTFGNEVHKSQVRPEDLEKLGITADELRALGVEPKGD